MPGKHGGKDTRRRRRLPRWVDRLIAAVLIACGIGLMIWPWVADLVSSTGVGTTISEVTAHVDALPADEKQWYLDEAHAYNDELAGRTPSMEPSQIVPYDEQLTFERDPMMSWVDIPSINVSMPIYHGTSDAALMAGVGHLQNTSLPVGGVSTHCVLTAHSGMGNLRMFDDIRQLVHCERTDYNPDEAADAGSLANRHWGMREWAALVAVLALVALVADVVIRRLRKKGASGR